MKKKKQQNTTAETTVDDKTLINDHALFLDKLVELIPAKFYISTDDDDKPWFQGLNKAAKAYAKHQTRENIKKARRNRLDPEKSQTSTLDIVHQLIESENADDDDEENPKPTQSTTYEALQSKLQAKLRMLRSNRGEGKRSLIDRKRKRSDDEVVRKGQVAKAPKVEDIEKDVEAAAKEIRFGKLKLSSGVGREKKKGSKGMELQKAKKLVELKNDPEKGDVVAKQHSWKAATSRAMGIKVHDDPKILKESIRKDKKKREKSAGKWKERVETTKKLKNEKQQKRTGNIAERAQQKKDRKIAKREKKLMRPGKEGRKAS